MATCRVSRITRSRLVILAACSPIIGLIAVLLNVPAATSATPARPLPPLAGSIPASKDRFAYFFDLLGDFEKIALATGEETAHGQLPPARGVVEPFQQSGYDGCVFCGARYDGNLGRLYAVMAKEATVSEKGTKHHEIVALELPQMHTAGFIDMGVEAPSAALVTPDGHKLFVSYESNASDEQSSVMNFVLSVYEAPTLKLLRTIRETITPDAYAGGAVVKVKLSERAYFGADGKTIYDEFAKAEMSDDQITKQEIDPLKLLMKSEDPQLQPFRLMDPRTKAYSFGVNYADSTAGKILVELNVGKSAPQGVCTIDANSHAISSIIRVSQVAPDTAHLTLDGGQILIEGSEFRHRAGAKPDEPQEELFWTGKVSVYDATSAKKLREFQASELAGAGTHLLCIADDGTAFYAAHGHLYRADLAKGAVTRAASRPQFAFDRFTQCVTADR